LACGVACGSTGTTPQSVALPELEVDVADVDLDDVDDVDDVDADVEPAPVALEPDPVPEPVAVDAEAVVDVEADAAPELDADVDDDSDATVDPEPDRAAVVDDCETDLEPTLERSAEELEPPVPSEGVESPPPHAIPREASVRTREAARGRTSMRGPFRAPTRALAHLEQKCDASDSAHRPSRLLDSARVVTFRLRCARAGGAGQRTEEDVAAAVTPRRNAPGGFPVHRTKARWNVVWSEKPRRSAASANDTAGSAT
jgi:hypothetical protein